MNIDNKSLVDVSIAIIQSQQARIETLEKENADLRDELSEHEKNERYFKRAIGYKGATKEKNE